MKQISKEEALEFCKLCNWAYESWATHKQLFDNNINQSTTIDKFKYFTSRLSIITQEYSLQQICKLHDPACQNNSFNLTINYMVNFGDWGATLSEIEAIQKTLSELWKSLQPARNKALAHNDLETIMNKKTLGEFPEGLDEQYFTTLQKLANLVHYKWLSGPYPFNDLALADADEFLSILAKA